MVLELYYTSAFNSSRSQGSIAAHINVCIQTYPELLLEANIEMFGDSSFTGAGVNRAHIIWVGGKTAEQSSKLGLEDLRDARQDVDVLELHGRKPHISGSIQHSTLGDFRHFHACGEPFGE